ncbi:pyridine nucleotide-disulfide oxidoreductase [Fusarium bulbicola]|nr:pyridine nucleotide-disulfide oxidoreductase [Fusarium bulbicola]
MPRRIIIVGGVAGGMSAATRLRRLDESAIITVFEHGAYTGFANCGIPYALGKVIEHDEELILRTPNDFKQRFNIDVHLGAEVVSIDRAKHSVSVRTESDSCIRQFGYDKLTLAQGAEAFRPPCAGAELDNVATMQTITDLQKLFLNESTHVIDKSRVILSNGLAIPADMVILAAGVRARTGLAKQAGLVLGTTGVSVNTHMQTSDPDIYAVGDMVETQNNVMEKPAMLALAGPANRQGRMAADHICGKTVNYRGNIGTSVCRVFGLTLGFVGLSTQELRQLVHDPLSVTVHPPDHAGYFPSSQTMTVRLAFRKETGEIMGAQIIGKSGVDKRIDVLATAMQFGSTVFDLEHLELGCAPPYGSAKDAVNMVGFVASNVLRGDCKIVQAEELTREKLDKMQVIDVRSPEEFARGHLYQAVNLPLNNLRQQLAALDRSRSTLVHCHIGYRGYLAYCILRQLGFDVVNLDGGFKTVVQGGYQLLRS